MKRPEEDMQPTRLAGEALRQSLEFQTAIVPVPVKFACVMPSARAEVMRAKMVVDLCMVGWCVAWIADQGSR